MPRRLNAALGLIIAATLFVAVNLLADAALRGWRLDLTENKLYTLSDGTHEVLNSIEEPVTLRFFFSRELARDYPAVTTYANRIEDLLKEIEAAADGAIDLRFVYPEPFSEAEDLAVQYGLSGVQTPQGDLLYFGLVGTNTVDDQQIIPYFTFDRERFVEYDIVKMIDQLSLGEEPLIGLYSALPLEMGEGGFQAMMQGMSEPYMIYEQLQELGRIRTMNIDMTRVDPDIDLLVLIHPGGLSESALYAIDQFILAGGHALILADPYSETAALPGPGGAPSTPVESSDLERLFDAWGLEMTDGKVVADMTLAQRVRVPDEQGRPRETDYPIWLELGADRFSQDDPVTANLEVMVLGSAGALDAADDAPATIEPLFQSTENSMMLDVGEIRGFPEPDRLAAQFTPDENRYTLAARVTGVVPSAFPDGRPAGAEDAEGDAGGPESGGPESGGPESGGQEAETAEAESPPAHRAQSEGPINVIVVADSDMVVDDFWAQVQNIPGVGRIALPVADNANFVLNAVDQLSGSTALIDLRSRGISDRPFTRIEALRRQAESEFRAEEERLSEKLSATEQRIRQLQSEGAGGDGLLLSPEQEAEIERFREQALQTREALREVQRNLRKDIEALEARIRFFNIALMPIFVILAAIGFALWRRKRAGEAA